MSGAIKSKGVSLADIFDPYQAGTTKARAAAIRDGGVDTSDLYANIIYGSAAAPTGVASENDDLNTLYAAKGTASYALPIAGNTYTSAYNIPPGDTGWAAIAASITGGNTYNIVRSYSAGSPATLASGAVPAGATKVQFTWGAPTIDTNDGGGSPANSAASPVDLSTNPAAQYSTNSFSGTSGTHGRFYPFTIDFFNAASQNISHTVVTLHAIVDGSA